MTASVFTDPNRGAALLVSDDPPFALGPVLVADEVEEAMEGMLAFIAALGEDPSEMPTIRLMIEWQGFLAAITPGPFLGQQNQQEAPQAPGGAQAGESSPGSQNGPTQPDDGSGGADESLPASSPADAEPDDPAPAPQSGATVPDDEDEDEDEDEGLDIGGRLADIPGGTPRQRGQVECFACGGSGFAPGTEGVVCNLCEGEGRIEAPEPAAATTTEKEQS